MIAYNVVTAICLGLMVLLFAYFFISLARKSREERILFLRGFKKGKGFAIYLISVPLYVIGHLYAGRTFGPALLVGIQKVVNTVVLRYEVDSIAALMDANRFYCATVYICFALVAVNAFLFSLSLFSQYIWDFIRTRDFKYTSRDKLIIVGNNASSVDIYKSAPRFARLIVDEHIAGDEAGALYVQKIGYLSVPKGVELSRKVIEMWRRLDRSHYVVVINTGDDERNLRLCRDFCEFIAGLDDTGRKAYNRAVQVYVFGNPQYDDLYRDVVEHSAGIIRYVDKYRQIAFDFVERYPLTQFMSQTQLDYATGLVRRGVECNVLLVGFGDTNQKIFLASVANNQFLTMDKGELRLKKVRYHVFDKEDVGSNKSLNHTYYRYRREVWDKVYGDNATATPDDYLPLPELPAEEHFHPVGTDSPEFYATVRSLVSGKNDLNYVVIAFGDDLANLDLANKLLDKKREWGITDLHVFVKAKTWCGDYSFMQQDECYVIADETATVYNLERILNDSMNHLAMLRNEVYDLESELAAHRITDLEPDTLHRHHLASTAGWYAKSQHERESSLYSCLGLRSKLHLMGLDYRPQDDPAPALDEREFLAIYGKDDMPLYRGGELESLGKRAAQYTLHFPPSLRHNLAVQEHYRWNAFMITQGFVPATKDEILHERRADGKPSKGKNYNLRRHGNITTYEGLVEFRRMVAEAFGGTQEAADVIKYDYQLLDEVYYFIIQSHLKIVRRE